MGGMVDTGRPSPATLEGIGVTAPDPAAAMVPPVPDVEPPSET
jgi:hypothetical protein